MSPPESETEWLEISKQFQEVWNMPHAIGCIDVKHIRVECLKLSGTLYYNYKGFYSIVLMAVCDANCCFTLFDLWQYGSNNDSCILVNSAMGEIFDMNLLHMPPDCKLNEDQEHSLPYYLLGDEIFPLNKWLMRPGKNTSEEGRIYNYMHSRARRCIEKAFEVLSTCWRIFHKPIRGAVENIENYTHTKMEIHCLESGSCSMETKRIIMVWLTCRLIQVLEFLKMHLKLGIT